ncbi:hypothetical protein F0P96_13170 [Hymenobacter busanensis]|uniref:Uncharacterized protein n=1 Tax=Hymenobacter busanensis TaxID=2607656 RepID=A0A7L4ZWM0_9BACT|nr:hypothetical protein [Hymenobacter busanensis]KAA9332418.1 hypothetical protein F0P96_13170 [Hymenobacter busanensis]QHJ07245.1 hypothetical protein GUY19_08105 [Hymenobacter busanensis]
MSFAASAFAPTPSRLLVPRLVALWALSEGLLGGILHAFKLPVTGLLVGGTAVVIIRLIGHYAGRRGIVLRGLLVVLALKAMLSPQSPPTAYVAVAFQGVVGEMLAWGTSFPRLRGVLLGLLTLVESAAQRVLMLWLVFGNDLPGAFNQFVQGLLGGMAAQQPNYALLLALGYLMLHAAAGVAIGWWAGGLPQQLPMLAQQYPWLWQPQQPTENDDSNDSAPVTAAPPRRWHISRVLLGIWVAVALLWLAAAAGWPPVAALDRSKLGGLLLRSIVVYGGWALVVAPLLLRALRNWLSRPRGRWAADLSATLNLLPATGQLVAQCWRVAGGHRGWRRWRWFCRALAVSMFVEPVRQAA